MMDISEQIIDSTRHCQSLSPKNAERVLFSPPEIRSRARISGFLRQWPAALQLFEEAQAAGKAGSFRGKPSPGFAEDSVFFCQWEIHYLVNSPGLFFRFLACAGSFVSGLTNLTQLETNL